VRNSFQEPSSDSPRVSRKKAPSGSVSKNDRGSQPPRFTSATQILQISKSNFSSLSQHGSLRNLDSIVSLRATGRTISAKLTGKLDFSDLPRNSISREVRKAFPSGDGNASWPRIQSAKSRKNGSNSCLTAAGGYDACSTFTGYYSLSARRVAKRPVCLEGSDGFVSSSRRFDSYPLERPRFRVGVAPTEDQHLPFTAHTMRALRSPGRVQFTKSLHRRTRIAIALPEHSGRLFSAHKALTSAELSMLFDRLGSGADR
jgi:hypothetical protein